MVGQPTNIKSRTAQKDFAFTFGVNIVSWPIQLCPKLGCGSVSGGSDNLSVEAEVEALKTYYFNFQLYFKFSTLF